MQFICNCIFHILDIPISEIFAAYLYLSIKLNNRYRFAQLIFNFTLVYLSNVIHGSPLMFCCLVALITLHAPGSLFNCAKFILLYPNRVKIPVLHRSFAQVGMNAAGLFSWKTRPVRTNAPAVRISARVPVSLGPGLTRIEYRFTSRSH
jgi:hypothetical protein